MRRHVDHERRKLKTALGVDHFEGRTCLGRHPHATLVSAAHLFLTMLRSTDPQAARPAGGCVLPADLLAEVAALGLDIVLDLHPPQTAKDS